MENQNTENNAEQPDATAKPIIVPVMDKDGNVAAIATGNRSDLEGMQKDVLDGRGQIIDRRGVCIWSPDPEEYSEEINNAEVLYRTATSGGKLRKLTGRTKEDDQEDIKKLSAGFRVLDKLMDEVDVHGVLSLLAYEQERFSKNPHVTQNGMRAATIVSKHLWDLVDKYDWGSYSRDLLAKAYAEAEIA